MNEPPGQRNGSGGTSRPDAIVALRARLLEHCRAHADRLLAEWKERARRVWNSRQAMQTLTGGSGAARSPSSSGLHPEQPERLVTSLIDGFHADLLACLEGAGRGAVAEKKRRFPHRTAGGAHFTLPYYLEALAAGEQTLAAEFLAKRHGPIPFSDAEAALCFEEINRAFHLLTETLGGSFCDDCALALHRKERAVANLERGFLQRSCHD